MTLPELLVWVFVVGGVVYVVFIAVLLLIDTFYATKTKKKTQSDSRSVSLMASKKREWE